MIIEKTYCDFCKKDKENIKRIYVFKGRKCDAAGQMEDDDYPKDLCPNCMAKIISAMQHGAKLTEILPE